MLSAPVKNALVVGQNALKKTEFAEVANAIDVPPVDMFSRVRGAIQDGSTLRTQPIAPAVKRLPIL